MKLRHIIGSLCALPAAIAIMLVMWVVFKVLETGALVLGGVRRIFRSV